MCSAHGSLLFHWSYLYIWDWCISSKIEINWIMLKTLLNTQNTISSHGSIQFLSLLLWKHKHCHHVMLSFTFWWSSTTCTTVAVKRNSMLTVKIWERGRQLGIYQSTTSFKKSSRKLYKTFKRVFLPSKCYPVYENWFILLFLIAKYYVVPGNQIF